jgi:TP53 regulating kinase-like protein
LESKSKIEKLDLIQKGAEASLFSGKWFGRQVIFKYRIPKKYRLPKLDKKIRVKRTLNEARALIRVKNYGINVPQVFEIDTKKSLIIMKFIKGKKFKDIVNKLDKNDLRGYFKKVGLMISKLHKHGHVHGDITTSNLILTPSKNIFLIDFGLHEYSDSIEDKSVDLHLLKRVLISSHGDLYKLCFKSFLDGYRLGYMDHNLKLCNDIINHINVIESRGRYVKKQERLL